MTAILLMVSMAVTAFEVALFLSSHSVLVLACLVFCVLSVLYQIAVVTRR